MTFRQSLGAGVARMYQQVDALLDREDGLLILFDGDRLVSYANGFDVSPGQIELLDVDLERSLRAMVGAPSTSTRKEDMNRETRDESGGDRLRPVLREPGNRDGRGYRSRVADGRGQSVRSGRPAGDHRGDAPRPVLRLARKAV
jgi:hypothetical protein